MSRVRSSARLSRASSALGASVATTSEGEGVSSSDGADSDEFSDDAKNEKNSKESFHSSFVSNQHAANQTYASTSLSRSNYRYSTTSSGLFARSPYLTRSSSKQRTTQPRFGSKAASTALHSDTPRKTLSFNGSDAFDSSGVDGSSTPGALDAERDGHVYSHDCCELHQVNRPNSATINKNYAQQQGEASTSLLIFMVLALITIAFGGPWFVSEVVRGGGVSAPPLSALNATAPGLTNTEMSVIIDHVLHSLRAELSSARYVDESSLEKKQQRLVDEVQRDYESRMSVLVSDIMSAVYAHVNSTMNAEQEEDANTNQKLKTDILKIVDEKLKQSGEDWSSSLNTLLRAEFQQLLASERTARINALGDLSADSLKRFEAQDSELRADQQKALNTVTTQLQQLNKETAELLRKEFQQLFDSHSSSSTAEFRRHIDSLFVEEQKANLKIKEELLDVISNKVNSNSNAPAPSIDESSLFSRLSTKLHLTIREEFDALAHKQLDMSSEQEKRLYSKLLNGVELSALIEQLSPKPKPQDNSALLLLEQQIKINMSIVESKIRQDNELIQELEKKVKQDSISLDVLSTQVKSDKSSFDSFEKHVKQDRSSSDELLHALQKRAEQDRAALDALEKQMKQLIQQQNDQPQFTTIKEVEEFVAKQLEKTVSSERDAAQQKLNALEKLYADLLEKQQAFNTSVSTRVHTLEVLNQEQNIMKYVQNEIARQRDSLIASVAAHSASDLLTIRAEIAEALENYSADRTAMADYALGSSGGQILDHSPTHVIPEEPGFFNWLKRCTRKPIGPSEIINSDMSVGRCWPMNGTVGFVQIGLRHLIKPTHVSIEHVSHKIAQDYSSAPKKFAVWGLVASQLRVDVDVSGAASSGSASSHAHSNTPVGEPLGLFTYLGYAKQLQTFELVNPKGLAFEALKIGFLENHGNPFYTCIYRVRIHGENVN